MLASNKPVFIKEGSSNVNLRWRVNAAGQPDSSKEGLYVGNVRSTIARPGYVGIASGYTKDGFRLIERAEPVSGGSVSIDGFFISEQYLTNTPPTGWKPTDAQGVQQELTLLTSAKKGEFGIPAPFGLGFDLPDWLKGLPGLILLAGTVYVATRKSK